MTAANLKFFEGGKKLKATEVIAKLQHSERSVAQENALALLHDAPNGRTSTWFKW